MIIRHLNGRHCKEERRSNPHGLPNYLIGSNQEIASSRHWDFDNSNILLAGFAMTVNQSVVAETTKQFHHKDTKLPKNKITDDPPSLLTDLAS